MFLACLLFFSCQVFQDFAQRCCTYLTEFCSVSAKIIRYHIKLLSIIADDNAIFTANVYSVNFTRDW